MLRRLRRGMNYRSVGRLLARDKYLCLHVQRPARTLALALV
jgi:hypothetical protein